VEHCYYIVAAIDENRYRKPEVGPWSFDTPCPADSVICCTHEVLRSSMLLRTRQPAADVQVLAVAGAEQQSNAGTAMSTVFIAVRG
jgi:hypothetical protein